jgi:hypothetical protein
MARSISEKRKQFMTTLTTTLNKLDPSGTNAKIYKEKFEKMSDTQFDAYIRDFFANEDKNFYLEIVEYERELTLSAIEEAAKYLKVPLYERVVVPYLNGDPNLATTTPTPVPVGYIHIKRMPQSVHHKSSGSTSIAHRSSKTGQVTGEDKNGRNTDVENYAFNAYGAYKTLAEFMGPRADDEVKKNQMYARIELDGACYDSELHSNPEDRTAINTLDTYYGAMGMVTNIVRGGYLLSSPKND